MSGYKRVIVYIFLVFFVIGCTQLTNPAQNNFKYDYKVFAEEDRFIVYALEYERLGEKENARELFSELYKNTLKEEYLLEYLKLSFFLKKYNDIISKFEINEKQIKQYKNEIQKVYITALIQEKRYEDALKRMNALLKIEKTDNNYGLLGTIYLQKGEYKKAKELFEKVYKNSLSLNALINLSDVMYVYLDEKDEALNYLETHIKLYGCDNQVCAKLLGYYQEEKNIDGIIFILKKSYYESVDSKNNFDTEKIYKLLMYYLMNKNTKDAILFLEQSRADDDKLLNLYRVEKEYEKAYGLANSLYEKSSNIDYLAQIAILEFEKVKDKKKVLKNVIKKFEDVLTVLDNHIYQNYLGYILIEFDVDIEKGLQYVKKALEKAPNNLAYIDSLAWGQYKLKDCKNAYINMKKVVDGAGLNDEEIKTHWKKIKECNK